MCLWRPGRSLVGAVTSADRTGPISLRRLRLPRLVLSRRVRFTNRFTEQAIDLQFPAPLRALPWQPSLDWRHRVRTRQATAKRTPRHATRRPGHARRQAAPRPSRHHRCRVCTGAPTAPLPVQTPPPNPAAAGPDGRRVLSRVGAADHAVTPEAPWTGSGWREYSYGGFGGGHPPFHPHTFCLQPHFSKLDYQLGNRYLSRTSRALNCEAGCPPVAARYRFSPGLMAR
jgi:hypothetical protein